MFVRQFSWAAAGAVGLALPVVFAAHAALADATLIMGEAKPLGAGNVQSFARIAEDGKPEAIGLFFDKTALKDLPPEPNMTSRCFDANGDGTIGMHECIGDLEVRIPLPDAVTSREDIPYRWAMVNWNAMGHPPAAWSVPHFDVHFYMAPQSEIDALRPGKCGELIDCDDYAKAILPVPPKFVNADYVNVNAAVPGMGNHLIDSKTPELGDPPKPFTHTWIFGSNDGKLIFGEVMLTHEYMKSGRSGCYKIKQPEAWQVGGWYPNRYCISYDEEEQVHEVSLQDFELRTASE